jgi:hypothetical protein
MDPGVYTFMAFESASTPPGRLPTDNLIIVDTFFTSQGNSFGTVTATKRHTKELGNMNYNIMHTSQGDITRAVTFTGITTFTICGFTIVNDADGINIERRALPLDLGRPMQVAIGVFDGYRGRLCLVLESPIRIQVYDYVGFKI